MIYTSRIEANGKLRHHFWGTYSATITLRFATVDDAEHAQRIAFPNWKIGKNVLVWHGKNPDLDAEIANLVAHGADEDLIDSVAHSIDAGDPFTVEINMPDIYTGQLPFEARA